MKQNENVSWVDVVRTQKPKQMATIANSKNVSRECELIREFRASVFFDFQFPTKNIFDFDFLL
jgi:hypothetical protein